MPESRRAEIESRFRSMNDPNIDPETGLPYASAAFSKSLDLVNEFEREMRAEGAMGRVSAVAKPTVTHVRGHEIVPEAVLRRRKTLAEVRCRALSLL